MISAATDLLLHAAVWGPSPKWGLLWLVVVCLSSLGKGTLGTFVSDTPELAVQAVQGVQVCVG